MRGSRFAAVLDEALRRAVPEPLLAVPAGVAAVARSAGGVAVSLHTAPDGACLPLADRGHSAGSPPSPSADHEQQRAFERLGVLGANLPVGFTAEELRGEYRRLARRFHPDRHGDCSALEREQRARNFAQAAESYSCLRALVETHH